MGTEVDQGLFDKVRLLPALQAFPAFRSKQTDFVFLNSSLRSLH